MFAICVFSSVLISFISSVWITVVTSILFSVISFVVTLILLIISSVVDIILFPWLGIIDSCVGDCAGTGIVSIIGIVVFTLGSSSG